MGKIIRCVIWLICCLFQRKTLGRKGEIEGGKKSDVWIGQFVVYCKEKP
jgi:hypothetical protein